MKLKINCRKKINLECLLIKNDKHLQNGRYKDI